MGVSFEVEFDLCNVSQPDLVGVVDYILVVDEGVPLSSFDPRAHGDHGLPLIHCHLILWVGSDFAAALDTLFALGKIVSFVVSGHQFVLFTQGNFTQKEEAPGVLGGGVAIVGRFTVEKEDSFYYVFLLLLQCGVRTKEKIFPNVPANCTLEKIPNSGLMFRALSHDVIGFASFSKKPIDIRNHFIEVRKPF